MTGGGGFGGGFLGSSFCADTAIAIPRAIANVNNIFCKILIAFIFPLSSISRFLGKEGKCVRFILGNLDAKNALMTHEHGVWLETLLFDEFQDLQNFTFSGIFMRKREFGNAGGDDFGD
jgi:hypothetical protein